MSKHNGRRSHARKPGRPKGSKNSSGRGTAKTLRDVIVGLEELEVGRARLRMASAAWNAPKTIVALAAIRAQARRVIKVLDPLFE